MEAPGERRSVLAALRSPWGRSRGVKGAEAAALGAAGSVIDISAVQVMAHTLIADLYGAGLRIQHIAANVPEEMQPELEEVADHIDKVIHELRAFAFQSGG